MAIYHCSIKTFSRSKGESAVAAAAYRNGQKLVSSFTGLVHDYTKRKGVVHSEIVLPEQFPEWAQTSQDLWNKVEAKETRKNSTVAREFEIALPHELSKSQRLELAKSLANNLVQRFGFASEFSIHRPDKEDGLNHHVHILTSTRKIDGSGFTEKARELDDLKTGAVEEVRKMVADEINKHLAKAGILETVDHRSLLAQQKEAIQKKDFIKAVELARLPTKHIGKNPEKTSNAVSINNEIKKQHIELMRNAQAGIEKLGTVQPKAIKPIAKKQEKGFIEFIEKAFWSFINADWFGIEKRQKLKDQEELKLLKKLEKQKLEDKKEAEIWFRNFRAQSLGMKEEHLIGSKAKAVVVQQPEEPAHSQPPEAEPAQQFRRKLKM